MEMQVEFRCGKCDFVTNSATELTTHFKNNHCTNQSPARSSNADGWIEDVYRCKLCDYSSELKENFLDHLIVHGSNGHYPCPHPECSKTYKSVSACRRHMTTCHKPDNIKTSEEDIDRKKFKCDKCKYSTAFKHHLNRHNRQHQLESERTLFRCVHPNCSKTFKSNEGRKKHLSATHGCQIQSLQFDGTTKSCLVYKCMYCEYATLVEKKFNDHVLSHSEIKKPPITYKCLNEGCTKTYISEPRCINHMRLHHKEAKICSEIVKEKSKFKCDKCDYSTSEKCNLVRHKDTHKPLIERLRFKCTYPNCSKTYCTKYDCRQHMSKKHYQEENFDIDENPEVAHYCEKCNYSTTKTEDLKNHQATHEMSENTSRFPCMNQGCVYTYAGEQSRDIHMLTCKFASDAVTAEINNDIHKILLTYKRPAITSDSSDESNFGRFICDQCGYSTQISGNFNRHKQIHMPVDERIMFRCKQPNCKKTFTSNASCRLHVALKRCSNTPNQKRNQGKMNSKQTYNWSFINSDKIKFYKSTYQTKGMFRSMKWIKN